MKLSVPTNWQIDLLEKLDKQNVEDIYGKLDKDFFGGGKPSVLIYSPGKRGASEYVSLVHRHGLKFNYLLNTTCLGNQEWTSAGQRQIRKLLDWLAEIGVDAVTVSTPYLLQVIKKCYPVFQVNVSVLAAVASPVRAKYWEDLGADLITLFFADVNRNFKLLKQIREAISCRLQLIANLHCLYGCPFFMHHSVSCSHASQTQDKNKGFYIDYCSLYCRYIRLLEPWRLISAGWIRPEDLHFYAEAGIDRIKLVDRIMKTEVILRIVDAYTKEKYEGNLLDLFTFDKDKIMLFSKKSLWRKFKYFFHPFKVNLIRLSRARSLLSDESIYLDNSKLENFIHFFIEGKCNFSRCKECGYCEKVGSKALRLSTEYRKDKLAAYGSFLDGIIDGSMFYAANAVTEARGED